MPVSENEEQEDQLLQLLRDMRNTSYFEKTEMTREYSTEKKPAGQIFVDKATGS